MNKNTYDTIIQLSLWLGIPALILGIMGSIHALLKDSLLEILKKLSFETISLLILILLSCLVVTVTCIIYLCKKLKEETGTIDIGTKLKEADEPTKNHFPKFGVLWDENKEPYCPACKTLLSQSVFDHFKNVQLECIKCQETQSLVNKGKEISLEEAKALLNNT